MTDDNEYCGWKRGITFVIPEPTLKPVGQGKVLARPAQASTVQRDGWQHAVERAKPAKSIPSRVDEPDAEG